jgi:hypothetical protein
MKKRGLNFANVAADWLLFTTQPDTIWNTTMTGVEREELKLKFDSLSLEEADELIQNLLIGKIPERKRRLVSADEMRERCNDYAIQMLIADEKQILNDIMGHLDSMAKTAGGYSVTLGVPTHTLDGKVAIRTGMLRRILTNLGYTVECNVKPTGDCWFRISILSIEQLRAEVASGNMKKDF